MIFNSVIAAAGSGPTLYSITNVYPQFFSIDKSEAAEGETVTVTVNGQLKDSWKIKVGTTSGATDVAVFTAPGSGWDGVSVSFTMPDGDVFVSASK